MKKVLRCDEVQDTCEYLEGYYDHDDACHFEACEFKGQHCHLEEQEGYVRA